MRGSYKVPGGKLVVADVEVTDGRLQRVSISGDFFLEPDEALVRIDQALTGLTEVSDVATLTAAIQLALAPDVAGPVEMVGFGPESVAIAVRRALGRATSWQDHDFQLIRTGPQHPAMQMALDEVIARQVGDGLRPPNLRIWEWASNAVIIGSFQSLSNEVDLVAAARHDVTVVRRISGGGAMFVEPGNTITYSLVVPGSLVEGLSFAASYAFLDDWVLGALAELGIQARYVPLNDIASPTGKIAGAAQKRLANGAVLHHVTMSYDIDADKMLDVLRIGREKLSDKGITSANKRVDPLRSQTGMSRETIIAAFIEYFRGRYGLTEVDVDDATLTTARALADSKFETEAWTARVP
ncbi:lipoate--protein ligase family protein [Nakamurella leprariae]|uniref:Lipoate--protein ligase family protein n=1 Tax=Nakamurella leprariae TaxID=2803911 RepID=A0A939C1B0_9ACTN|nr:biotin/lipoate A/B protein ligase family protein [Nakamurella leprariae]MBM9466977.1 lipoate--protein ligase family protein [Nakamurella leprariae]